MILEEVHVQNLLSHADSHLDFTSSRLWLICGKNGSGKSALFDAVEYALYGSHRAGKRKNMKYLIKHGASRATIQLIFWLHGERYRVIQTIDNRRNNGRVARWEPQEGSWVPINVDGESSEAIWGWLDQYLPSHDLFRSAIYLRQSDTAHFFSGNANERGERFAALIDLSRYTLLWERAVKRQRAAERRRDDAKAKRDEQGDVSDQAVQELDEQIQEAEAHVECEQSAVKHAETTLQESRKWHRLLDERTQKETEQRQLRELLRDREEIERAECQVKAWNLVVVPLARYWQRRTDAKSREEEARKALHQAEKLTQELKKKQDDLEQARTEQEKLENTAIPVTQAELGRWKQQAQALKLEVEIAATRTGEAAAAEEVSRLIGAAEELHEWQARDRALSDLRRLAKEREAASTAQETLQKGEKALDNARLEEKKAQEAYEQGKVSFEAQAKALHESTDQVSAFLEKIARLSGQIEAHGRLTGEEHVCPVCDQLLDEAAHEHVHQVLAEERKQLDSLKRNHEMASQTQKTAERATEKARNKLQVAEKKWTDTTQEVKLDERQLEMARRSAKEAVDRLIESQHTVERDHPYYATQIDQVNQVWVRIESENIHAGLQTAQKVAEALTKAKTRQHDAQTKLTTLRSQRANGANPLGDMHTEAELGVQQTEAQNTVRNYETELVQLREQERGVREQVNQLTGKVQSLEEKIRGQHSRAESAQEEAHQASAEAEKTRQERGPEWFAVMDDLQHYEGYRQEIERLRQTADKVSALLQADGRLEQVRRDLERNAQDMGRVPSAQRLQLAEAQKAEDDARERLQAARDQKTKLKERRSNLDERCKRAECYEQEMQTAEAEAADWSTLAQLLKPGGDIQVWITNREQQQIIQEVNLVLEQLDDPLRVHLGEPLRRISTDRQDVVVVDRSDPTGAVCHFELLSGGEQFRIALALALALHRRVAGGVAGTLIVDEGFGVLDSDHRDTLAQQMADTSGGILRLGLAQNIILCSHSSEVQRHFQDRWIVEKQGGTATVDRVRDDESVV